MYDFFKSFDIQINFFFLLRELVRKRRLIQSVDIFSNYETMGKHYISITKFV